jgi:DEK C terminal domain
MSCKTDPAPHLPGAYSYVFTVPKEVEASYATIIDSILAGSDLNTVSAKTIRKGLQAAVEYDITHQKVPWASWFALGTHDF